MELVMFILIIALQLIFALCALKVHWFFGLAGILVGIILIPVMLNDVYLKDTLSGAVMPAMPYGWFIIVLTIANGVSLVEGTKH